MKFKLFSAIVALTLLLTACPRPPAPRPPATAQLRALHGVADGPSVDVLIDGAAVLENITYKQGSAYLEATAGERSVRVTAAGDAEQTVLEANVELDADRQYTVIVLGQAAAGSPFPIEALVLDDTTDAPEGGNVKLRVVHGAPEVPAVDVYVTGPDDDLDQPTLEGVSYRDASAYLEVASGDYRVRVTLADSTTVIYDSGTFATEAGQLYTIVALPEPEVTQSPITLVVLQDDDDTPSFELPDQATESQASLMLSATVGLTEDACATVSTVFVTAGETVYFCYTVTNTGAVPVPLHTVSDSLFGVLLEGLPFELAPDDEVFFVTEGVALEQTTVNSAIWVGLDNDNRIAAATASAVVNVVAEGDAVPFAYAAAAGTFVGGSNSPTIGDFEGNVLFIGVRDSEANPVGQKVRVNITVPDMGSFDYLFDPATAADGIVALLIGDFEASFGPMSASNDAVARALSQALSIPVEVVTVERPAFSPQAAVGGEFVFAFPGQTITRTVDADAKLTVPAVTNVTLNDARDALTVDFTSAGSNVSYQLFAFGRGPNAFSGSASTTDTSATITLSGALAANEAFVVEVNAAQPAGFDPMALFDSPLQPNLAQYLHYSE